jgi:osmotically-inducible protein OsmY
MTKSNTYVQLAVMQELKYEASVHASEIGVPANDGIVSLTGNVKNYPEKYAALGDRCVDQTTLYLAELS